ncbi:MAG: hypothetical protein AB1724_12945 [Thermodesulfobacteriota bacterium]
MKRITVITTWLVMMLMASFPGFCGCDCDSDPLVQRWVQEKNGAAMKMVKAWAHNAPMSELAPAGAIILSHQIYILAKCKDNESFLENNLFLGNGASRQGGLELLPALIIEKMTGQEFFSPIPLFESKK